MVSALVTSPEDHDLIISGDARPIRIELNSFCSTAVLLTKNYNFSLFTDPRNSLITVTVLIFIERCGYVKPIRTPFDI